MKLVIKNSTWSEKALLIAEAIFMVGLEVRGCKADAGNGYLFKTSAASSTQPTTPEKLTFHQ